MATDGLFAIENFFSGGSSDVIKVGDPNAVKKFYDKIKRDYNLEEMQSVLDCDDNMLIVSSAGSGKTTTLILKIIRDYLAGKFRKKTIVNGIEVETTGNILVSTFLKSGAVELSDKLNKLVKEYNIQGIDTSRISFRTIHSEVYNALVQMGVKPNIVPESDTYKYIKKACKDYNIHSVMGGKSKELTKEEIPDIACILTYSRNRLDNTKFEHPLMAEYGMGEIELKAILEEFKLLKAVDKVQDFEDLEEILYDAYDKFPNVIDFIKSRYDYVYLDEFQDTSQLQYAILKPYLESAKGFVAVGDDDQCIYGWRGSDVSLIQEKFEKDFKPVIKKLSVNRRCKENILNPIIPSIEENTSRHKKELKASQKGGEVTVIVDGGASYLMKSIREDLMRSEDVGILGRTNADLLIPALLLELDGYSSFSLSKSVSLSDRIPSQVIGIMDLITQRYNEKFEGYFKLFLNKYNSYEATKLCDVLSTTPEYSIYNIDLEDLEYSAPSLFGVIRMLRREVPTDPVGAYVQLLEIMEQDVYNGRTIYAQRARDFTYYMRKIIQEHERIKDLTIDELYHLFHVEIANSLEKKKPQQPTRVQKADGSWVTERPPQDNSYVRITTVHDAKGKQWANVYIWNDVDGCFPNTVGNRPLTKEEFEEERRVHYIAWTRAVNKLTVFTRSDRLDGFLKECDLSNVNVVEVNENKKLTKQNVKKSAEELLKGTETTRKVEPKKEVVKDWVWYFKEYVKKYTSYSYICTPKGSNLDICLTKFNGIQNLVEKLREYHLEAYPISDLDDVISDILESLVE